MNLRPVIGLVLISLVRGSWNNENNSSWAQSFPCRNVPLSAPLPFPWFCHQSGTDITVEGSSGVFEVKNLGQLKPDGVFIYGFKVPPDNQGPSRVRLNGNVVSSFEAYSEDCHCPVSFRQFNRNYACRPSELSHLDDYFDWWAPNSVTMETFDETYSKLYRKVVRVLIIDNKVYTNRKESIVDEHWKVLYSLLVSVSRKVVLPNIEFLLHYEDVPLVSWGQLGAHVFGMCSTESFRDILLPNIRMIRRLFQGMDFRMAVNNQPWETRESKVYFRGSNTGLLVVNRPSKIPLHERSRLVMLTRNRSDLFDLNLRFKQGRGWPPEMAQEAIKLGLGCDGRLRSCTDDQFRITQFKYVLNVDGFVAPFRTHMLLLSGGLILKTKSPFYEYFYKWMSKGKHYWQIERLPNIVEEVEELRENEKEAWAIAKRGGQFATAHLRQENVLCWTAHALSRVKAGLAYEPTLRDGFYLVNRDDCSCN